MKKTKIIIVSSQILIREALASFLNNLTDFEVIAETACSQEAIGLANHLLPELILADIELSKEAISEIAYHLAAKLPSINLLFLSSISSKERLIEAIPLNARGYLTTDLTSGVFTRLLKDAAQGISVISPSILADVLEEVRGVLANNRPLPNQPGLTPREKEVLLQLASGATNRAIARSLIISECTVKNHIHNMLDKLKIQNRTQLISYALTNGLVAGY